MRFVLLSLILMVPTMYCMKLPVSDKFIQNKNSELVLYKEPKQLKIESLEKRLYAHADVIIIGAVIVYGIHTILNFSSPYLYPSYFYCDR